MSILKCPVCDEILELENRTYLCSNRHSFDLAKEKYANLVLNAKKSSGDSKEMMNARKDFLSKDYYKGISDKVNDYLSQTQASPAQVLDIGCGEGYYLSNFEQLQPEHQYFGLDISKLGIKLAAKRNPNINWFVANFTQLPFTDHSIDTALSMFAEYSVNEIERIMAENGQIIIVRAASDHLVELKEVIYPQLHEKEHAGEFKIFPNYQSKIEHFSYQVTIQSTEDLLNLLAMTPHYWKIKADGLERLKALEQLTVTISIEINHLTSK